MSDSTKWRPPVAPKPNLTVPLTRQRDVSPALRGATLAFSPTTTKSAAAGPGKPTGQGALNAATSADRARKQQEQKTGEDARHALSPARGRSQLSVNLHATAVPSSQPESKNPLQRTASYIAAQTASANSSPVRGSNFRSRAASPVQLQRSSSRESSYARRGRQPPVAAVVSNDGVVSSSVSPPATNSTSPVRVGKIDFNKLPVFNQSSVESIAHKKPSPKPESRSFLQASNVNVTQSKKDAPPAPPPKRQPGKVKKSETVTDEDLKAIQVASSSSVRPDQESRHKAPSPRPPTNVSEPITIPAKPIGRTSPHHAHEPSPRSLRGSMTAHNLADAMVASSLASSRQGSRAASPAKHHGPPLPRRRSRSMEWFRPHHTGDKAPPLKPLVKRPMKQTLRKHSPEDEEEEDPKRGRKHRIRKHPNMHHEGDRKRWRDKINERERKRYEGVWAANRGLLHEHETSSVWDRRARDANQEDLVLNVVVREIWSRSRLPSYALEEIWDLVSAEEESKALDRYQFVVGMWLIDQRLKGRKLPIKVSASVWASVRSVGIKVSSKPF